MANKAWDHKVTDEEKTEILNKWSFHKLPLPYTLHEAGGPVDNTIFVIKEQVIIHMESRLARQD